jgi:taurine dioxygenase
MAKSALPRSIPVTPSDLPFDYAAISPEIGAEIRGIDLGHPLDRNVVELLRSLLDERLVLVIRDQILTPTQHVALMSQFGQLAAASPVLPGLDVRHHQVKVVDGRNPGGRTSYWHSDITYMLTPPSITSLFARILPTSGGDTEFASATSAYRGLSAPIRSLIDSLSAVHDDAGLAAYIGPGGPGVWDDNLITELQPVSHPLVVANPRTGTRSLFVNHAFTKHITGLDAVESDALLSLLLTRLTESRNTIRINWQPGTLVLSDNRATIHRAIDDYGTQTRVLHKVSVRGNRPTGSFVVPAKAKDHLAQMNSRIRQR